MLGFSRLFLRSDEVCRLFLSPILNKLVAKLNFQILKPHVFMQIASRALHECVNKRCVTVQLRPKGTLVEIRRNKYGGGPVTLLCSLHVQTFVLLHNSAVEINMTSIVRSAVRPVCRFLDRRFFVPSCCHVRWSSASSQVSQASLRIDTCHEIMFKSQY